MSHALGEIASIIDRALRVMVALGRGISLGDVQGSGGCRRAQYRRVPSGSGPERLRGPPRSRSAEAGLSSTASGSVDIFGRRGLETYSVLMPLNTIVSAEPGDGTERLMVGDRLAVFDDEDGRLAQGMYGRSSRSVSKAEPRNRTYCYRRKGIVPERDVPPEYVVLL